MRVLPGDRPDARSCSDLGCSSTFSTPTRAKLAPARAAGAGPCDPQPGPGRICKRRCRRRTGGGPAEVGGVTTLESTTERLEGALRRLAVEAGDLLDELLRGGAELPFEIEPT